MDVQKSVIYKDFSQELWLFSTISVNTKSTTLRSIVEKDIR